MADLEAKFAVNLEGNVQSSAQAAAGALGKLRSQIEAETAALANMKAAMKRLQDGATVDIATFKALEARMSASKNKIADLQRTYIEAGGSFAKVRKPASDSARGLSEFAQAAQVAGGPLVQLASRAGALRGILGAGVMAAGLLAVAAAIAAVAVASIAGAASLIRFGLAAAGARRDELLHLEGLTKLRNWYGLAAGKATDLQAAIDKASGASATGRGAVAGYAESLYRAGLRGESLTQALEAMSIVSATQGEGQAQRFYAMAAGARFAGQSVKRLSDDVKARLGGIAQAQLLSLNVQGQKLRENLAMLFSGLHLEPVLRAVKVITDAFSQQTASGRALKTIIEAMFAPMARAFEYLAPIGRRFFQGMVIGALLLTIMLLRVRNWFVKTFGDSEIVKSIDLQRAALFAGVAVVGAFAAALGVAAIAVGALAAALGAVGYFVYATIKGLFQIGRFFAKLDWAATGRAIIDGIVNGLLSGASRAFDAIKGLATGIKNAFTGAIESHSPSRVFMRVGATIPQGVQQAVRLGRPDVEREIEGLVRVPTDMGAAAAQAGGATALALSSSVTVQVGDINIHTAATDAKGIVADVRGQIEQLFEDVATQLGARRAIA